MTIPELMVKMTSPQKIVKTTGRYLVVNDKP